MEAREQVVEGKEEEGEWKTFNKKVFIFLFPNFFIPDLLVLLPVVPSNRLPSVVPPLLGEGEKKMEKNRHSSFEKDYFFV